MNLYPTQKLLEAFGHAVRPPEDLLVSEWARRHFRTSSDYSAVVGKFEPHPYQIEPLDFFSSSCPDEKMVLMCGAQMTKTLILLIALGYIIDHDPGPVLIVQPTGDDAESFSSERIGPMIQDVPVVGEKMAKAAAEAKSRASSNKILQKRFRGGQVSLTGAVSDSGLRRRSVRYLLCDEIDADGYGDSENGDKLRRAEMRTVTYWNRKILFCSTPTVEGGRIHDAYLEGDQRQYFVPCPFCAHEQVLVWDNVRWGKVGAVEIKPENAHYLCAGCGELIPHHRKTEMLRDGRWIAQNPEGKHRSYQISRLYAPDWSWGRVVVELFIPAKTNVAAMRNFRNEVLAEPWREQGNAPDHEKLMSRREPYRLGQVPQGVLFLTAGFDVQKTWGEGYVYGWGRNKQRWVVDHHRINHDPYSPKFWEELDEFAQRMYKHPSGVELPIIRFASDTGHATNEVYMWARRQGAGRVLAVDGRASGISMVSAPSPVDVTVGGRKIKHGVRIWPVNVSMCKSELYGLLGKDRPAEGEPYPAGWVHFPRDVDGEFFKQLTAENLVYDSKRRRYQWKPNRERNEALDCANYARAAAAQFGIDRFSEAKWRQLEQDLGVNPGEESVVSDAAVIDEDPMAEIPVVPAAVIRRAVPPPAKPARAPITSTWMRGFTR